MKKMLNRVIIILLPSIVITFYEVSSIILETSIIMLLLNIFWIYLLYKDEFFEEVKE